MEVVKRACRCSQPPYLSSCLWFWHQMSTYSLMGNAKFQSSFSSTSIEVVASTSNSTAWSSGLALFLFLLSSALSLPSLLLSSFSAFSLSLFAFWALASFEGVIGVTLENHEDEGVIKRLLIQKYRSYAYQSWTAYAVLRNPITWKVVPNADPKSAHIHWLSKKATTMRKSARPNPCLRKKMPQGRSVRKKGGV